MQNACGINTINSPTIIFEDNAACVAQIQTGYVKSNITKHILPKLFFTHELQKKEEISVTLTKSCDNLGDIFTKSLPTSPFEKCVRGIGLRRLREVQSLKGGT